MDTTALIEKTQTKVTMQYEKNIAFFKENMNAIYETLCANTKPVKLSFNPKTGRLEELVNHTGIYNGDALNFAIDEVNNFYNKMEKIDYRPTPDKLILNHLILKKPFIATTTAYTKDYITSSAARPTYADLVIFGTGLGYHIEILCNKKTFSHYTIIEDDIEIFKQSLYTIDWAGTLKNLGSDRKISIIINDPSKPESDFQARTQYHLAKLFPSIALSTLVYSHAYTKNSEVYSVIKKDIFDYNIYSRVSYERLGPDAQRLMNANENCKNNIKIINLNKSKIKDKDIPIAIIGAGPSLDKYIDTLKNNQDKLLIVSCGSSIKSLLKNGIKPNYHFELEFLNLATDLLVYTNEEYDLSDIELLCSFEGNPGYQGLFKKSRAFVQATTEIVNHISGEYILYLGGLTCTNGATALTSRICDNNTYFFGMDFAHTYGEHHAIDNITNQTGLPEQLNELEVVGQQLNGRKNKRGGITTLDTQGNTIETTPSLNSARALMEHLCEHYENKYYNCSDGASIENTTYLSIEELDKKLSVIEHKEKTFDFIDESFDSENIHQISKNILNVSFDVCEQILDIAKYLKNEDNQYEACRKIIHLVNNIKNETSTGEGDRYGQYRSIMSFNRQPLLLLFGIVNYGTKHSYKDLLDVWVEDYKIFLNNARESILPRFENKEFYITEEWLDS